MSGTTSTTVVVTPEIVRAFADYLEAGNTGSLDDFANSDAGKAAATAMADQKAAAEKSARLANVRAFSRDIRDNGEVTAYSKDKTLAVLAYLKTVDFDAIKTDAKSA